MKTIIYDEAKTFKKDNIKCLVFENKECTKNCQYKSKCWHRKILLDKRKGDKSAN